MKKYKIDINLILPIFLVLIMYIPIIKVVYINTYGILISIKGLIISVIIIYIIYMFIILFCKNTFKALCILNILTVILNIANQIKIAYMEVPVLISDIYSFQSIEEVCGLVEGSILQMIDWYFVIFNIIFSIIFIILAKKNSIDLNLKSRRYLGGLSIIFLMILSIPFEPKDKLIIKNIINQGTQKVASYYMYNGVLCGMYGQYIEGIIKEPDDYDVKLVESLVKNTSKKKVPELGTPNIIFVFSESFWNIQKIDEVRFKQSITPNLDKLQRKGTLINVISPTYGGGSANVSTEILTGSSCKYFSNESNVFMQIYNRNNVKDTSSVIKELKNNGYYAEIIEAIDYYSSNDAYKKMGVDKYYLVDKEEHKRYWSSVVGRNMTDKELLKVAVERKTENKKVNKTFYMILTIQNHMPYYEDKYDNYNVSILNSKLNKQDTNKILCYAQGVHDADEQLGMLYNYINNLKEPTILVFMGDHLPYIYDSEGKDLLQKLSYFNTGNKKLDTLRKYNTQALILNNYNAKIDFNAQYITPDNILVNLINNMDINISDYYRWLYNNNSVVGNNEISVIGNDIYYTSSIPNKYKANYNLRKKVQYRYVIDN